MNSVINALLLAAIVGATVGVFPSYSATSQSPATPAGDKFEVASVSLDSDDEAQTTFGNSGSRSFRARHVSLKLLIQEAYGVRAYQIIGLPSWAETSFYDVAAQAPGNAETLPDEKLRPMVEHLLEDRFHLILHKESRPVKGYVLQISKKGATLQTTTAPVQAVNMLPGYIIAQSATLETLSRILSLNAQVASPVANRTGLAGNYAFRVAYSAGEADADSPDLFSALKEQLGLELVPKKIPVDLLIVDSVKRIPTPN